MTGTFNSGTGTVNYNGPGGQSIKGTTYNHLTTSGSGTKVLQAATTVNGNLAITGNSTLLTNQFQISGNAAGTLSMDAGTNLLIGNPANSTIVSFPLNFTSSNILLNSNSTISYQANTSQTISALPVYGHLTTATSGAKILENNITVTGNLIIGTIGSLIGWFLMGFLKVETSNVFIEIAMAVTGAVIFFLLIGILRFRRKKTVEEEE